MAGGYVKWCGRSEKLLQQFLNRLKAESSYVLAIIMIRKMWKQCKCPTNDKMDKPNKVQPHNGMLFRDRKEYIHRF